MVKHMVFEYLYRDAGNYKAWGELLLEGDLCEAEIARMTARFDSGEFFIAEQIGIPTLYELFWQQCQGSPSAEYDHVWHQFSDIRPATDADIERLNLFGNVNVLLDAVEKVDSWNLEFSQNFLL